MPFKAFSSARRAIGPSGWTGSVSPLGAAGAADAKVALRDSPHSMQRKASRSFAVPQDAQCRTGNTVPQRLQNRPPASTW